MMARMMARMMAHLFENIKEKRIYAPLDEAQMRACDVVRVGAR